MWHFMNPMRLGPACGPHRGLSTRDPSLVTCARCVTTLCYRVAADLEDFVDQQRRLHEGPSRAIAS